MQDTTDFRNTYRIWKRLRRTGHPGSAWRAMQAFWRPGYACMVYVILYLASFSFIENMTRLHYTNIHVALDDLIPFCELFVIPYYTWFVYMIFGVGFLFLFDRDNYHKSATMLYIGMTLFIVVSLFWPNIQYLRPEVMPRDNVLTHLVQAIYSADTPTNLCPSIHVYNTLVVMTGVHRCRRNLMARSHWYRIPMYTMGVLIILSTMFIKQHSVFDVVCAFGCYAAAYLLVYRCGFSLSGETNTLAAIAAKRRERMPRRVY